MIMNERSLCVVVGKYVGSACRKTVEKTGTVRNFLGKAVKSVTGEARVMAVRVGNLFKKVKTNSQLAHWEMRQKDGFSKLGEEMFRAKGEEITRLFKDANVKKIVQQVQNSQGRIQNIKNEINGQQKRMDDLVMFRHATGELRNPDSRMRLVALRVLGKLGKREAIPCLVKLLDDPHQMVRRRASEVIQKLTKSNRPAVVG